MEHLWAQGNVRAAVMLEAVSSPWVHHMQLGALWILSYSDHHKIENVSIIRVCF